MNIVKANIKQVNTLTKEGDRSAGYIGVPPPCGWLNFMAILQTLTIIASYSMQYAMSYLQSVALMPQW